MMLINMVTKGNANVKNLVQTIVQHQAFRETNNSILTATNQEQLTYIVLIVLAEIWSARGASAHPAFMGNCQRLVTNDG